VVPRECASLSCIASIILSRSDFIRAGYFVPSAPTDRHLSITPLQAKFKFQSDKTPSLSKKISSGKVELWTLKPKKVLNRWIGVKN
jgi:hypothetical protein